MGILSDLLTVKEACAYLRVSEPWIYRKRREGSGPRYIRMGTNIRYRKSDLDAYIEASAAA